MKLDLSTMQKQENEGAGEELEWGKSG